MFCKKCGNKLADSAQFCEKCGQSVDAIVQPGQSVNSATTLFAPAGIGRRLANHILDSIFLSIFCVFGFLFFAYFVFTNSDSAWLSLIIWILYLGYFLVSETLWQKTPAKFITKTKVVMRDGTKPPFLNIFGRTFARLIPFEKLSFLFSVYPRGWHDQLSKTLVVPNNYSVDDVKKIDFERIKSEKGSNTALVVVVILVCVIVGIAIIGILSSVVLVSLNTARQKGQDAQTRVNLSNIRVAIETYRSENNTYTTALNCNSGIFSDTSVQPYLVALTGKEVRCYAQGDSFAISVNLNEPNMSYCIDSKGYNEVGVARNEGSVAFCSSNI